ncbi:hypothetical protein Ddc_04507 [Ditylenchus destructor]|nr:hypothetical protein Ddc_04507 [Ditylenchus destructor]
MLLTPELISKIIPDISNLRRLNLLEGAGIISDELRYLLSVFITTYPSQTINTKLISNREGDILTIQLTRADRRTSAKTNDTCVSKIWLQAGCNRTEGQTVVRKTAAIALSSSTSSYPTSQATLSEISTEELIAIIIGKSPSNATIESSGKEAQ